MYPPTSFIVLIILIITDVLSSQFATQQTFPAMMTALSATRSEAPDLDRLTLSDILSDLDLLSDVSPYMDLLPAASASASAQQPASTHSGRFQSNLSLLDVNASGSTSEFITLSRDLLRSFRNAQRLNTEQVSLSEVSLLLPSERGQSWPRSSVQAPRATRTDLLHAKVAGLQTSVDEWDVALQAVISKLDSPAAPPSGGPKAGKSISDPAEDVQENSAKAQMQKSKEEMQEGGDAVKRTKEGLGTAKAATAHNHVEMVPKPAGSTILSNVSEQSASVSSEQPSIPQQKERSLPPSTGLIEQSQGPEDFEDDDPWNELT